MEEMAHELATSCATAPSHTYYGVTQERFLVKNKDNTTAEILAKFNEWWKEGAAKQVDTIQFAGNEKFTNMARDISSGFACSYQYCSGELNLVCLYAISLMPGRYVYNPSETGRYCEQCMEIPEVPCVDALCQVQPEQETSVDYLMHSIFNSSEAKLFKQCNRNVNTKTSMTDDLREMALSMHNNYRRLLATGFAKDGQIGYAKPATRMTALTYDCTLEDKIMTGLSKCRNDAVATGSPQNFKAFSAFEDSRKDALQKVIAEWWKPIETTGIKDNLYRNSMAGTELENYVNMANEETNSVGCGVQHCPEIGKVLVQCAYNTSVLLHDGDEIYTPGDRQCRYCYTLASTPECSWLEGLCIPKNA
ncbi:hypothetical protein Aduo_016366 [Ancylostoma duodenale]